MRSLLRLPIRGVPLESLSSEIPGPDLSGGFLIAVYLTGVKPTCSRLDATTRCPPPLAVSNQTLFADSVIFIASVADRLFVPGSGLTCKPFVEGCNLWVVANENSSEQREIDPV